MSSKWISTVVLGTALFVPAIANAQGTGAPNEETVPMTPNRALLTSGAVMFGVPYISSVLVAASTNTSANHFLYIPVAGPWLSLGAKTCSSSDPCTAEGLAGVLLVTDGIFQAVGAGAMVMSLVVPESRVKPPTLMIGKSTTMTVTPAKLGPSAYGVATVGQF
jgi:hypothetical protein